MNRSESYFDIVWRQFKKNRFALVSLWILGPLFLLAIFAPVIASNQPFHFDDGEETIYPWFRALFNPAEAVDYAFNMALLGFVPWVVLSLGGNWLCKRRDMPGRQRIMCVATLYALIIVTLCIVFGIDDLRPANTYARRTFQEEEFAKHDSARSLHAIIPFGPGEQDDDSIFKPPLYRKPFEKEEDGKQVVLWKESNDGVIHLLGTDNTGRDILVRMIYGSRISLTVGFVAVSIYMAIGIVVGAIAGYFGGVVDILISRLVEVVLLFPAFFLILTLVAIIGPSIYIIMVVIGLTRWATVARLIRGEVLKQRSSDYVMAARGLGASHRRILFRHILPNAISPALVAAPFGVASAIITEAAMSLLGFGVPAPTPSWGTILKLGSENYNYWWLVVVPSAAMFVLVTVFNLVGSGLRDAMDPRLRR